MIPESTIEKIVEEIHVEIFSLGSNIPVKHITAIVKAAEKLIKEQASEGFSEFVNAHHCNAVADHRYTWQAATLAAEKKHREEIEAKDLRIKQLESELVVCLNDHTYSMYRSYEDIAKIRARFPLASELLKEKA